MYIFVVAGLVGVCLIKIMQVIYGSLYNICIWRDFVTQFVVYVLGTKLMR